MTEAGAVLIIALILFGVLVGGLAQLLVGVPWREIDWPVALACGLAGSFVGGLLASIALGDGLALRPSGLLGSLVGAVLVTLGWTLVARRRAD
jgi:uncharacterized membrane protein YeaQ/YmgE (transglycosylase-associated protein family)